MTNYILNDKLEPVEEPDILKWAKSHGMIVSKDVEGEKNVISENDYTLKKWGLY